MAMFFEVEKKAFNGGNLDLNNREELRVCCLNRIWKGGVGMVVGAFEESCEVGGFQGFYSKD